jgi:hypothetical protein
MATIIDPPQPVGVGEYPIDDLVPSTIKVFTNQADYAAKMGKPCPVWNSVLPLKSWIDTAPASGVMITYNTAHLDPTFQHPIVTQIQVPAFLAGTVNIPPDSGQFTPSSSGQYLTPIRPLLANEKLVPRQMGLFDVVNTDIYDPTAPPAGSGTTVAGGSFTDADRDLLTSIAAGVGKIVASMGMTGS